MMVWPGVIPVGIESKQVVITMDWTRTILAVADAVIPERSMDGIDVLPIVTGKKPML